MRKMSEICLYIAVHQFHMESRVGGMGAEYSVIIRVLCVAEYLIRLF